MNLTRAELNILSRFHKEYFTIRAYVFKRKPPIAIFIENEKLDYRKTYFENLLALYYFKFWSLGYAIKEPSNDYIMKIFKAINYGHKSI